MILRLYHVALGLRTKVHDARLEVADNEDMRHYFKAARNMHSTNRIVFRLLIVYFI